MADSTQYLIELAARFDGGDTAIGQLTQMAERLSGTGSAAATFDAALGRTKAALQETSAASLQASADLAQGEAKYAQLERAAVKAAAALERAAMKGKATPELEQRAQAAASALRGEATALDQLRARAAAAAAEHSKMTGAMKNLEAAAKAEAKALALADAQATGTGKLNEMAEGLGRLGGPMGTVGQQVLGLFEGMGKLGGSLGTATGALAGAAVGVAALAAAVVALGVAAATAVVKVAVWAVGLADARRNAALATEALSKTHASLANIGQVLPKVASGTTLAAADLQELSKQLAAAGVSAADMPAALRAVALAEDALGKGGASQMIEDLKAGKKTIAETAAEAESKFGGIVAKKLLSLDAQAARLKKNFGETFGGLKIEGLLEALAKLVALFDQNTAMGKTLKAVFEGLFQPLIDATTKAIPVVEAFVLGIAIGGLKIAIAMKPAVREIKALFGAGEDDSLTGALDIALFLGKALAAAIGTVVVGIGLFAGALAAPVVGFMRLYGAGYVAWESVKAGAAAAVAYLESVSLGDIASNMIQGLADGITGGASKVVEAMRSVVTSAIKTATTLLDSHSPSRVFEQLGKYTTEGFAQGVTSSAGEAQSAMQSMVAPPAVAAGAAGGGGNTFQITVNASGGDAEEIARAVRRVVLDILEGNVIQLGAGGAPGAAT